MRSKSFVLIVLLIFTAFGFKADKSIVVVFLENSSLHIEGKTNVSKFSCLFDFNVVQDSIRLSYQKKGDVYEFKNARLKIKNEGFDCGGKAINKDFHKLLKTDKYPEILMNVKKVTLKKSVLDSVQTQVEFTLNNITKGYTIQNYYCIDNNTMQFCGTVDLNIEDFDLKAPKKVLGIIKVKNVITIDYNFKTKMN